MTTRADRIAQVVRRRHQVAAERRRLLAFALHAGDDDFEEQVTLERPPLRVARGTTAPPSPAIDLAPIAHEARVAASLAEQVERLRSQTAAFRAQAIALNAKLAMCEAERHELYGLREHLAHTSARLEHAVDEIDAVARLDDQLAILELT
jgi:hypothetical protein